MAKQRDLTDRVVAVVGATGGLGSALCTALRSRGATVITAGRSGGTDVTLDLRDCDAGSALVDHARTAHGRLDGVKCPVLWMQGTADRVYSVVNAEEEIGKFVNSADAKLSIVKGGQHFLSSTNPREVNSEAIDFINRWT